MAENTHAIKSNKTTKRADYRVDLQFVSIVCVYVPCLSHNTGGLKPVQMGTEWLYALVQATQSDKGSEG